MLKRDGLKITYLEQEEYEGYYPALQSLSYLSALEERQNLPDLIGGLKRRSVSSSVSPTYSQVVMQLCILKTREEMKIE